VCELWASIRDPGSIRDLAFIKSFTVCQYKKDSSPKPTFTNANIYTLFADNLTINYTNK